MDDRSYLTATRTDDDPGQDERGTFAYYLFFKVIVPGIAVFAATHAGAKPHPKSFQSVGSPYRSAYRL